MNIFKMISKYLGQRPPSKKTQVKNFKLSKDSELPDLPSDGILVCLEDLEMCEKHPDYYINMDTWHMANRNIKKCAVCLGGARLARIVDDSDRTVCIKDIWDDNISNYHKIEAMDSFRRGNVYLGVYTYLNIPKNEHLIKKLICIETSDLCRVDIPNHILSPGLFKLELRKIAKKLKEIGL